MATSPNITNFSSANSTTFQVDGLTVYTDNANQPWSLTEPNANTLEFSVHPGDNWVGAGGGWSDAVNDGGANRSEIQFQQFYSAGTQINVSYGFTLQPGPVNNSTMVDIGQLHSTTQSPPSPVTVNLNTHDQLQISIQNPTSKDTLLWTAPAPIHRGQTYQITLQMNMNPTGNGYVGVWIDGTQVVNYHGPVGAAGAQYYWKEGIYRGPSDQIMTADYTNTQITTGPQAAPTSGTSSPTTPTSPTSPPNVAPTVTQASASPGTGVEHVGNTVTLTLGFSEAVTVTGTPTLSLNDGAKATYVGGSGSNSLTFKTTVASTDTSTSALAITGVNLLNGASIKDAGGLAANLSGAAKTFSGLQVDPTSSTTTPNTPTTPTAPTTPTTPPTSSVTKPVLTIADNSLWVAGRGGTVDLGTKVTTTDSNDLVTVNITGLPRYESITDKLDGQTFRGNNITLTAAQVDSGLTLTSTYSGGGHPVATLALTASAKDPSTGAVATASPQTITVVDPRPTTVTTTTSSHHHHQQHHHHTTSSHHHHHHHTATDHQPAATTTAAAPTSPQTIDRAHHPQAIAANTGDLASRGFALLQQHFDPAASTLATTGPQAIAVADHPVATGMASFASHGFALLNQYLAGHTGQVDVGQIVSAVSQAIGPGWHGPVLAQPQH